jgi:hypothetical protein
MGQELNQLVQGAGNLYGDFTKAFSGDFGGAARDLGGQLGSLPGVIGQDLVGQTGLLTNPLGNILGSGSQPAGSAKPVGTGETFKQGNLAAAPPTTPTGGGGTSAGALTAGDPTAINLGGVTSSTAGANALGVPTDQLHGYEGLNLGAAPAAGASSAATPASTMFGSKGLPSGSDYLSQAQSSAASALPGGVPQIATPAGSSLSQYLTAAQAGATPQAGGVQGLINSLMTGAGANPLKTGLMGLEGAAILKDVLQGQPSQEKALKALATQEQQQAQMQQNLANAAQQGQLPQAVQARLDQQAAQQKAAIRQKYAEAGMSGSTSETADLAAVDTQMEGQRFALGQQLAQSAFAQSAADFGSASDYLQKIMALDMAQGTALGDDIGRFASMLTGGGQSQGRGQDQRRGGQ